MEPEGTLLHSEALATCPYPKPDQSSPCLPIPLLEDYFYIILSSTPKSSKQSLSFSCVSVTVQIKAHVHMNFILTKTDITSPNIDFFPESTCTI